MKKYYKVVAGPDELKARGLWDYGVRMGDICESEGECTSIGNEMVVLRNPGSWRGDVLTFYKCCLYRLSDEEAARCEEAMANEEMSDRDVMRSLLDGKELYTAEGFTLKMEGKSIVIRDPESKGSARNYGIFPGIRRGPKRKYSFTEAVKELRAGAFMKCLWNDIIYSKLALEKSTFSIQEIESEWVTC